MSELIDRQAAISVIAKWMLEYGGEGEERERNALKQAAEEIKELPSAQPERMTNFEWITQDERMVAIWLSEIGCGTCPAYTYCHKIRETVDKSCFATLCSWLKCDAKEEEI